MPHDQTTVDVVTDRRVRRSTRAIHGDGGEGGSEVWRIRVHGRGGQGVVTTAELLSVAAFHDGFQAQAFPSFGSERMGAPVTAYCRISRHPIRVREPVAAADALLIADTTLIHQAGLFDGLQPDGYVLVNSSRSWAELGVDERLPQQCAERRRTVPATAIARRTVGRPLPNAPMLGAFAALTGAVSFVSVDTALRERFIGAVAEGNVLGARVAYEMVGQETQAHA
jgi:pyruvate ferredoxin oxidoreductase gamma subunit